MGKNGMKLLKLVIVDDEAILLQGLVKTYNWNEMGFEVAGQAQSGEQASDQKSEATCRTDGYPDETGFRSDGDGRDPEDRAGSGFYCAQCVP